MKDKQASIGGDFSLQLERFEEAWQTGSPPDIADFLSADQDDASRRKALIEFVIVDLEYRWKLAVSSPAAANSPNESPLPGSLPSRPLLEDYLQRYPELGDLSEMPLELICEEYRVRRRCGDRSSHDEYLRRFPSVAERLTAALSNIDKEIEAATTAAAKTEDGNGALKQIGPYKLLQQIGEGGMGTVWMAEQEKPVRRRVALKLVRGEFGSKETIARFEAERQALAMMDHNNIAKVLDAGTTDAGSPYFVMELVKGIPITEYCDNNKLNIAERLELFIPVCKAVQHAHQKGIIHRDLKPSNVLVTLYDGKPVAKVIDFGLAKALDAQSKLTDKTMFTQFGQVVGTVQYMSPEQAEMNALDVDTRTDVYSLGVMLYELLTGSTPLDKETLGQNALLKVLEIIRETEPPRPSDRLSSSGDAITGICSHRKIAPAKLQSILRGELDWVVMKPLEKDRTRRYDTASSFADDIENYLSGNAVEARPPSTGYRLRKTVQKHKVAFMSGTVFVLLLLAGLIGTGSMWLRSQQQAQRAEKAEMHAVEEAEKARASEKGERIAREAMEVERNRANEEKNKAEATLARSNYFLAVARWDANRAAEANDFLDQVPAKYRQFEWRLAKRQFRGSDVTCYGHTSPVTSVSFSPDGARIVSASYDKTIKLWDASSGEELRTLTGHTNLVTSVSFSPDGARIVSASWDGTIKLWDTSSGEELRTLKGHTSTVSSVSFSPDGARIASASSDNTIKLWDASSGEELRTLKGHTFWVNSVSFSPDGARIASASWDETIKFWNASGGEGLRMLTGHTGEVRSVSFSPDGARIASGGGEPFKPGEIKLWDASSGEELRTLTGHTYEVTSVSFSPDGARIASAGVDGKIKLWDASSGEELRTLKGDSGPVYCMSFSPDGARIASAGEDRTIKLWDTSSGEELRTLKGHTYSLSSVSFSPDGARIASAGGDQLPNSSVAWTIKLWDALTGAELRTLTGHGESVTSVSFSPDGTRIASASSDYTIMLWDVSSGKQLRILKGHVGEVTSVSFSPDGARIVSAGVDGKIMLWDASSGEELRTLKGHGESVTSVSFSPDGARFASASEDRTINLWDASSGEELRTLTVHKGAVISVSFSRDGARLHSEGTERLVWNTENGKRIDNADWNPAQSGQNRSPDGRWLAVRFLDGIRVVDLEFKNQPDEKAYRAFKAKPKPYWHQEQAEQAKQRQHWFDATFHAAWWLKLKPDSQHAFDALQNAHGQLDDKVAVLLPQVVAESLAIPQPTTTSDAAQ